MGKIEIFRFDESIEANECQVDNEYLYFTIHSPGKSVQLDFLNYETNATSGWK